MANMIKVRNKAGRTTHFNRETFSKLKADKEGYRNGWKESDGSDDTSGVDSSGVPDALKVFKGNKKIYSEEDLNAKIAEAIRKDRQSVADERARMYTQSELDEKVNEAIEAVELLMKDNEKTSKDSPVVNKPIDIRGSVNSEAENVRTPENNGPGDNVSPASAKNPPEMLKSAGANLKDGMSNAGSDKGKRK